MKITRQQLRNLIREQLEQASGPKYRVGDMVRIRAPGFIRNKGSAQYDTGLTIHTLQILEIPGNVSDGSTSWNSPLFLGVEPRYMGTENEEEYMQSFAANQIIPDDDI